MVNYQKTTMQGRKPIPGAEKAGDPGCRDPIGHRTVKPEPAFAPSADDGPPMELDEYGRAEWDRVTAELRRLGVLQKTDLSALATYCRSAPVVNSVGNIILKDGLNATIGAGRGRRSALKVYNEAVTTFVRLATEFGSARGALA